MKNGTETSSVFKTRGPLDPVADAAVCVPRPELDILFRAAQAPTIDAYLAILSSRQTGKTTLLYQLRTRLRPRGYGVALIDLSFLRDQSETDLYRYVASQIISELESTLHGMMRRRGDTVLPCNPVQFRQFMLDTARHIQAPRIVILLDEIETVSEKHADAFFGTVRNIFSSRRKQDEAAFGKYLFVICGARELHRLTTGPNSPFNVAERIYLKDLTLDGVRTITAAFPRVGLRAPREAAEWIYEYTRGHPYLTQKLCAEIESLQPGTVTREVVQRASSGLLKSDDHLEKMLVRVDDEPGAGQVLERILNGRAVPFSRLQPFVARLELMGVVRDAGQCAIRNPIYDAALRTHFNMARGKPLQIGQGLVRLVIFIVGLAFFLLNLPFLYNYASDIYLATRSVNDQLSTSKTLGSDYTIHYDRVLHANSSESRDISVDMEGMPTNPPTIVTLQSEKADITLEGSSRRTLDQPFQQVRFRFMLNQNGLRVLRYNPFNPVTDHRKVSLIFEVPSTPPRRVTYTADFVVDYWSDFIFSAVVSIASFIGALGAIFGNMGLARRLARVVSPANQKIP